MQKLVLILVLSMFATPFAMAKKAKRFIASETPVQALEGLVTTVKAQIAAGNFDCASTFQGIDAIVDKYDISDAAVRKAFGGDDPFALSDKCLALKK